MDKKAALQKVFQEVYLPTFLKRAEAHGIRPDSQESLDELLKIAAKIRAAGLKPQASKQAAFLKQASAGLDQVLSQAQQGPQTISEDLIQALKTIKS